MSFNSLSYLIFFVIFFLFWSIAKRQHYRRWNYIVFFSFVFYGWWDWRFLFLLVVSGMVSFWSSANIDRHPENKKKILIYSLAVNLGLLSFFKYAYFFADVISSVVRFVLPHFSLAVPENSIVLPVGISFYTFQSLSYTLDVYRGKLQPVRSIMHYFAYLSMFPQLVAGPIVRASEMLHQLEQNSQAPDEDLWQSFQLIVLGYFQKVVIADNLAPFVNMAFLVGPGSGSSLYWWAVMTAFSFQIYFDFSGYSNIARGTIGLMGYRIGLNFNNPYLSTSLREFWTRWHISLSTWFRDYVYIPLGGNSGGKIRSLSNMWITMLLSGLWHGAALNFVSWGAVHAFWLMIERITTWPQRLKEFRFGHAVAWLMVFAQVVVAWVFFRAKDFGEAMQVLKNMFFIAENGSGNAIELKAIAIIFFVLLWEFSCSDLLKGKVKDLFFTQREIAINVLLILACVFLRGNGSSFIYFQF